MPRTIFENIVIQKFKNATELAFCQYTPIRFFEILHIEKGRGTLIINNHQVPYNDNQIFILVPNDHYNLEIETPTTICAIKFLNNFFASSLLAEDHSERNKWFKKIETILHSAIRTSNLELNSKTEERSINALFNVLCNEYNDEQLKSDIVLKSALHAILHIISRNVNFDSSKGSNSKIQEIVNYIHLNIHDAEKLSKKTIASKFYLSENYISEFFKREMGIGLKKYILNYKIKLAETRLKFTDLNITEIALELGFTDSSHLDKTFQSYKGVTAKAFKNSLNISK